MVVFLSYSGKCHYYFISSFHAFISTIFVNKSKVLTNTGKRRLAPEKKLHSQREKSVWKDSNLIGTFFPAKLVVVLARDEKTSQAPLITKLLDL